MLLIGRGVSAGDCARYAVEPSVSLPFSGYEQEILDLVLEQLADHGYSRLHIAAIVEMSCIGIEGAVRLGNFGAFKKAFEDGS